MGRTTLTLENEVVTLLGGACQREVGDRRSSLHRRAAGMAFVVAALLPLRAPAATYYVRPDGGSADLCTGQVNAPYPGVGASQPCAWDHPFRALPPHGTPRIAGGDTLIIGAGSYKMGYGAAGADACETDYPWDCSMPPPPGGVDPTHPTRILGAGWNTGCGNPPELWGNERAGVIINLTGVSNAEVACLELTDHSDCVEFHSGGLACERDTYPFGPWAAKGIYAEDSSSVHLADLDIHGFASAGVHAGRLTDWTVDNVRIAGNGWVGWDGDIEGDDSSSGTLLFRRWTVEWNGCGESYPGGEPVGCWAQSAGGYGDGVGFGATAGTFVIEDSAFLHNTSDGLDLLYATTGSSVTIRRSIAEGNAGNQLKTSGATVIENSIVVSNCSFFDGEPFTFWVDHCRARGNALSVSLRQGDRAELTNNTVTGEGDCLVLAVCTGACDGSETLLLRNNIFLGQADWGQPGDRTCLLYQEGFPQGGAGFDIDHSIIYGAKYETCPGTHDLCGVPPGLVDPSIDAFDAPLVEGSPAIDRGDVDSAPREDFDNRSRDEQPDCGAYEYPGERLDRLLSAVSSIKPPRPRP